MIPTKDKNLLLLPVTDGGVTQPFNMPNVSGYNKNKATHNGVDIGWCVNQHCDILACQDGKVVDKFYDTAGSTPRGYGIVLEHSYADGTRRFTGYIHLKQASALKIGDTVKQGQKIATRGGSPYINGRQRYGTHLHLYVTASTTKTYSWATLKSLLTLDPMTVLCRSNAIKYDHINSTLTALPILEEVRIEVAKPVPRNEMVDQLLEKSSNLRVRMKPNLKGTIIGYLPANVYYDFYDVVQADGYNWYQIEANQWVAQTGTMVILPHKNELDVLKEENAKLKSELDTKTKYLNEATATIEKLVSRIASIRELTIVD